MRSKFGAYLDGVTLLLISLVLLYAPLRMGFVESESILLLFIWSCALFAIIAWRQFVEFNLQDRLSASMRKCMFVLLLLLCYILIQIIPMPKAVIGAFSPGSMYWWNQFSAYGIKEFATLSLDISATLWYFIMASSYFIFFIAVVVLVNTEKKLNSMLLVIFFLGQFQVLFDVISKTLGYELFSAARLDGHSYRLTGTFLNSNNVSALINLSFLSGVTLVANLIARYRDKKSFLSLFFATFLALSLFILIYGSIKAGSSGGMLSLLLATGIILVFYQFQKYSSLSIFFFILLCFVILFMLIFFGSRELNLVELTQNLSLSGRIKIWRLVVEMWQDFVIVGVGAGAFEWTLPIYKNDTVTSLRISTAHSGHLQYIVELGLIGVAIISLFCFYLIQCFNQSMHKYKSNPVSLWIMLIAVIAFLIHEIIDNHFLIPAVTLPFICISGMLVSISNFKLQNGIKP